jgi:hypothetical protein
MLTDRGSESCSNPERHGTSCTRSSTSITRAPSAELEIRARSAVAVRRQFGCDETSTILRAQPLGTLCLLFSFYVIAARAMKNEQGRKPSYLWDGPDKRHGRATMRAGRRHSLIVDHLPGWPAYPARGFDLD